jgi:hypothetical protein
MSQLWPNYGKSQIITTVGNHGRKKKDSKLWTIMGIMDDYGRFMVMLCVNYVFF